jgi:hypothetical protein
LGNRTSDIRDAAVEWTRAQDSFTIDGWERGQFALAQGHSHLHPELTKALSRVMAANVARTVLADKNTNTPNTYGLWDEVTAGGKIESLPRLLSLGRKKGLAAVIAYQSAAQLEEVYGAPLARVLNGLTPQRLHCRTSDAVEADAISRHFGETQRWHWTRSFSSSDGQSPTRGVTQHLDRIRVLPPEAIMGLPVATSDDDVIWAYVINPIIGMNYACPLPVSTLRRILPSEVDDDDIDDDDTAAACAPLPTPSPLPPAQLASQALPEPTTADSDDESLPYMG